MITRRQFVHRILATSVGLPVAMTGLQKTIAAKALPPKPTLSPPKPISGIARCAEESANPDLWHGLVGVWCGDMVWKARRDKALSHSEIRQLYHLSLRDS